MKALLSIIPVFIFAISGCKEQPQPQKEETIPPAQPLTGTIATSTPALLKEKWCYAAKTPAMNMDGAYNYHFIRLEEQPDGSVSGVEYSFPYGTDSYRASVKGVINKETRSITATLHGYAEGSHFDQQRNFGILDNSLELDYNTAEAHRATLPQVSCKVFDSLLREYRKGIFKNLINTTDRSRLKHLDSLKAYGFTGQDLEELRFMERAIDLDRDPTTTEYLIYLMDPSLCGTGGCNLLIVDSNNTIVADITVTKLPIYTLLEDFEESMAKKGQWKDLFVYSKGMRRLSPKNGAYPTNPSVAEEVLMEQLTSYPENYQLLMDYPEE